MTCKYYQNLCNRIPFAYMKEAFCHREGEDCTEKARIDYRLDQYEKMNDLEIICRGDGK